MELCPGGDLLAYVRKRRKIPELQAKYIFKQIMKGVAYLHRNLIVHRDIKLENILLDGHGRVKIGDFGVSKKMEHRNEILFEQCGTPTYIAPEIVREHGYLGCPVDVWSSGVCLYAMIFGNVPFKQHENSSLSDGSSEIKVDFNGAISEECKDLITGMLSTNVKKRLTAEQVLQHEWLKDTPALLDIFDEQEKQLIRKEFNNGEDSEAVRNAEPEEAEQIKDELNTEFTEYSIESKATPSLLRNSSSRSVIFCPFNTVHK
jgi:serine/threonine protein kinase